MQLVSFLYSALLFFLLTPGILVTLPKGGSKTVVAATHALVFAVVCYLTHKRVVRFFNEGFQDMKHDEKKMMNHSA
jgi:hypothetical protein